jgi:hypothetical protein
MLVAAEPRACVLGRRCEYRIVEDQTLGISTLDASSISAMFAKPHTKFFGLINHLLVLPQPRRIISLLRAGWQSRVLAHDPRCLRTSCIALEERSRLAPENSRHGPEGGPLTVPFEYVEDLVQRQSLGGFSLFGLIGLTRLRKLVTPGG